LKKALIICVSLLCMLGMVLPVSAAKADKAAVQKRIMFIPHDNRPISDEQTAEVVKKLGYEIVVPPDKMLGGRTDQGHPDELWAWAKENAKTVQAAVISSDSMLYGSLVGSRKHSYTKEEVLGRAQEFNELRDENPKLRLYVFGSIMRTPRSGEASGTEEPGYYRDYGSEIFRYTALADKKDSGGLTRREMKEYTFLQQLIPDKAMHDWMDRRAKNFAANEYMIDLTRQGKFDYFILGRDDNAPHSQTHKESRELGTYAAGLAQSQYQSMAGIDEIGLLLLSRAVNSERHDVPFVYVRYNWGSGGNTVPSYSDEKISDSIRAAIIAAGGLQVTSPDKADFVLAVNTNPNGKTGEANNRDNNGIVREGTKYFASIVEDYLNKGYPVGIADIAFANGADNALLSELKARDLLFKIRAYAGWNTATNSTGFVIGEGMMAAQMTDEARDQLLLRRYLDDWAYQANVRTVIGRQLGWLRGTGAYSSLDDKRIGIEARASRMMNEFAEDNMPPLNELSDLKVTFPWNRMFEADIETAN
jgi:hypothetical protein